MAQWFRSRTEGASGARKTKMIVALARKLLIALWRMVTTGEVPHGVVLRQAAESPYKNQHRTQSFGTSGGNLHAWLADHDPRWW